MCDAFVENIKVLDSWTTDGGNKAYRLVDKGAGPNMLQIIDGDATEWRDESSYYVHGMLCQRILHLRKLIEQ